MDTDDDLVDLDLPPLEGVLRLLALGEQGRLTSRKEGEEAEEEHAGEDQDAGEEREAEEELEGKEERDSGEESDHNSNPSSPDGGKTKEDSGEPSLEEQLQSLTELLLIAGTPTKIWKPLDSTQREIRLVSILSAEDDDAPIHCRLVTVALGCPPRFEAVSYAWGNPENTSFIIVNNVPWKVSRNLVGALRVFRDLPNQTLLWIDGLCINQTDIEEKNHQIPLMGEIYSSADKTRVWLGEENIESVMAIGTLKLLPMGGFAENFASTETALQAFVTCQADLFQRPWWQRLWILQEYILAKKVDIYCGEMTLDRTELEEGIKAIEEEVKSIRELRQDKIYMEDLNDGMSLSFLVHRVLQQPRNLKSMAKLYPGSREGNLSNFVAILCQARGQQVSDDRDRIYSLLGMAPPGLNIPVDYNSSVSVVYTQAALAIMRSQGTLALLTEASLNRRAEGASDLPSWVPDWRDEFCSTPAATERLLEIICHENCSGHELSLPLVDGNTLRIRGRIIDEVSKISEGPTPVYDGLRQAKLSKSLTTEDWNFRLNFMPGCQHWNKGGEGAESSTSTHIMQKFLGSEPSKEGIVNVMRMLMDVQDSREELANISLATNLHSLGRAMNKSKGTPGPAPRGENFPRQVELIKGKRWRAFKTEKGHYGLATDGIREGDKIAVLSGGLGLYVLKPSEDSPDGTFDFMGECISPGAIESVDIGNETISSHIAKREKDCEPWYTDGEESFQDILLM